MSNPPKKMKKTEHPLYALWSQVKMRGLNPKKRDKPYYGDGVGFCDTWLDFWQFVEDMGARLDNTYSIDRIDNDKGYYPDNCKWVSKSAQNRLKKNSAKYPGVRKEKSTKYLARIKVGGRRGKYVSLGTYDTDWEAAQAYNRYVIEHGLDRVLHKFIAPLEGKIPEKGAGRGV